MCERDGTMAVVEIKRENENVKQQKRSNQYKIIFIYHSTTLLPTFEHCNFHCIELKMLIKQRTKSSTTFPPNDLRNNFTA